MEQKFAGCYKVVVFYELYVLTMRGDCTDHFCCVLTFIHGLANASNYSEGFNSPEQESETV